MFKKLIAAVRRPFHAPPVVAIKIEQPRRDHVHSFSCACQSCVTHTDELTRERLKRQAP